MKQIILYIALTFLLTSCGFHLRGYTPLPQQLHTIYIDSAQPNNPFNKKLRHVLHSNHVQIARNPQDAPISLHIIFAGHDQVLSHVSSTTQVRQYTMRFRVTYELLRPSGEQVAAPQTVRTTRNLSMNENQRLGSAGEEHILRGEMESDAVMKLMQQLGSEDTAHALADAR